MAAAGKDEFFEGTEKLLEIWFSSSDDEKHDGNLKTILRLVYCDNFAASLCLLAK